MIRTGLRNTPLAHAEVEAPKALPVRVEDLAVRRGGRLIFEGVSVTVPAGKTLAVVGPNGCGKSTLLRTLAGLTRPAQGEMWIGEHSMHHGLAASRRAHLLAFVSQEEAPAQELTVAETVALGRTPHRKPWAGHDPGEAEAVSAAMAAVGISDLAESMCSALSGGQRHRAVLARALAQQTPVLLLDEPTNHLDPVWRLRLLAALRAAGRTTLYSVHELDTAVQFADVVIVLHEGKAAAVGPPREVLQPDLVRRIFEVESGIVPRPNGDRNARHLVIWSPPYSADRQHRAHGDTAAADVTQSDNGSDNRSTTKGESYDQQ